MRIRWSIRQYDLHDRSPYVDRGKFILRGTLGNGMYLSDSMWLFMGKTNHERKRMIRHSMRKIRMGLTEESMERAARVG